MTADMLQHTRDVLAARHKAAREQQKRWDREEDTAKVDGNQAREQMAHRQRLRCEGVAEELERVASELGFDLRRGDVS